MNKLEGNIEAIAFDQLLAVRNYAAGRAGDLAAQFAVFCAANMMRSAAQLFQDLLVVFFLGGKRDGFFVEIGATNGIELSNTVILERSFGWRGILAEPARCWHAELKASRRAAIDTRLVWSTSGERLDFKEAAELSTLPDLAGRDANRAERGRLDAGVYPVETVSLNDLLAAHAAPRAIDYLSIDTEGSELTILEAFDFSRHDVGIITVEHNFVEPDRGRIHRLLTARGFVRVFEPFSKFDDWYVARGLLGGAGARR